MKIIKDFSIPEEAKNGIITVGVFDGVHKGHQFIFQKMNEISIQNNNLPKNILTFENHPAEVLLPNQNFQILTTLEEKLSLLASAKVDNIFLLKFTKEFSQLAPSLFIEQYLIPFRPKYIVIGRDHYFGHNRTGNVNLFFSNKNKYGYSVIELPALTINGENISSTKIRELLKEEGNVSKAEIFLGYKYKIRGKVVEGHKIGKKINFPTANLLISENKIIPANGVYAVYVYVNNQKFCGMLFIGKKLTSLYNETTIEVNIFDFNKTIYNEIITIEFIARIRDPINFNNISELQKQLKSDTQECKKFFV